MITCTSNTPVIFSTMGTFGEFTEPLIYTERGAMTLKEYERIMVRSSPGWVHAPSTQDDGGGEHG